MEKVKSVSGNLRIGPKTFCENAGILEWILFILKISGHSNYVEKCSFSRIVHNFLKKMSASKSCMLTNFGMSSGSLQYICHGCQSEQMHPTTPG